MEKKNSFKSNTTSSIMIKSTMENPNVKLLINSVSVIIFSNIMESLNENKSISSNSILYNFSEDKYIEEFPEEYTPERIAFLKAIPLQSDIYEFIEVFII